MLYQDETVLWRFALPRRRWWRHRQRYRLPHAPLEPKPNQRAQEHLKRQVWKQYRSWSRLTSGVLLDVIGAVPYGTDHIFYKIAPHVEANEFRHYIPQVMTLFAPTEKKVVMVVDRSGIHRARKLASTLEPYQDKFAFTT